MPVFRRVNFCLPTKFCRQVQQELAALQQAWQGCEYELLTRNCNHFCEALCARLQVPALPAWLNRAAYGAEQVLNFANSTVEQVKFMTLFDRCRCPVLVCLDCMGLHYWPGSIVLPMVPRQSSMVLLAPKRRQAVCN